MRDPHSFTFRILGRSITRGQLSAQIQRVDGSALSTEPSRAASARKMRSLLLFSYTLLMMHV
jgi:hypothetical protein